MSSHAPPELEEGRTALGRGAWDEARERLERALEALGPAAASGAEPSLWVAEAWDGIGLASYWLDDPQTAVEAHERAYRLYRSAGRTARAARAAIWLADHYLTFHGSPAVARGWLERADSLLEAEPAGAEHAWLHIYRGHYALMIEHEPGEARVHAGRALEIAREAGSVEAEMVALSLEGLALVCAGEVREGMPRLDEASAAAVSREMGDLNATAWACCYLIHGCESVRDFERAAEWCERVKAFCTRWGLKPIFGACRAHYASVLTWRGDWGAAERELEETMSDARASRPPIVRAAVVRLAELRWRQGELDEAEVLLESAAGHPLALLGQAAVALDRGRPGDAAVLALRFLRHVPIGHRTERVDGLALLAVAAGEAGRLADADRATEELDAVAATVDTPLVWGSAHLARGAAAGARGDARLARSALEDAVLLFDRGGAPFEGARARLILAELLIDDGHGELGRRELRTAEAAFRSLGAVPRARAAAERLSRMDDRLQESRAAADARPSGASAEAEGTPQGRAAPPLTERELEVLRHVAEGLTNSAIAERLYLSPHTVKRHVANILTRLGEASRAAAVARAARAGWL